MTSPVQLQMQGSIAIVTIDNPPVNATSRSVRQGLLRCISEAEDAQCQFGMIRCAGRTFVAGGDITEFGSPPAEPHLPDVYNRLESSSVYWAAAMYGNVLGGGLELAMACDLRVAIAGTLVGLTEVKLGLVPGAGGSQRLPRLVGVELAVDMTTTGRLVPIAEFAAAGGVDHVLELTPQNPEEAEPDSDGLALHLSAVETATLKLLKNRQQELTNTPGHAKPNPVSQRIIKKPAEDFFAKTRNTLEKKSNGLQAPLHNLDAIEWALAEPFERGQPRERQLHLKLRDSEQSGALRHLFFAERQVGKPALLGNAKAHKLNNIGVIGGGLMGTGIAAACLLAGFEVTIIETNSEAVATARERVDKLLKGALDRGKISDAQLTSIKAACKVSDQFKQLSGCDLVIEAVFEDLAVKQQVFEQISQVVDADCLIATNTSYLDPVSVAANIEHPQRALGLHFFSPAHIMRLVEIVQTPDTSNNTLATAFAFTKKLGKTGVLSGICDGFIGNRMLSAYRRQADYLLADGALPQQVDSAMREFGMPMGPYELQDLTGLQIAWANRQRQADSRAENERYISIADQLCEMDRLGQRTGSGWYRYEKIDGKLNRKPIVDDAVTELVERYSDEHGIVRRSFSQHDIQQRMLAVLANEGARIVEEGIAGRDLDVDVVKVMGYGFPRWRGGPLFYASSLGDDQIAATLQEVCDQSPSSWTLSDRYRS